MSSTLLVLLLACAPASSAPSGAPPAEPAPAAAGSRRDIDAATLRAELEARRLPGVVDVRTPGEYAAGHVPGAVNVPMDQIEARAGTLAPAGQEVVLICAVGGRSALAADTLARKGLRAVNVTGGTDAWVAAGFPVEK
jgi:rhodanese-related sulfurtransferase